MCCKPIQQVVWNGNCDFKRNIGSKTVKRPVGCTAANQVFLPNKLTYSEIMLSILSFVYSVLKTRWYCSAVQSSSPPPAPHHLFQTLCSSFCPRTQKNGIHTWWLKRGGKCANQRHILPAWQHLAGCVPAINHPHCETWAGNDPRCEGNVQTCRTLINSWTFFFF